MRSLPHWYVHTWDRTRGAERSFRLDRMRSARLLDETFERRDGFDELRPARIAARILYLPGEETRRRLERPNARALADGSALVEDGVGAEWIVGEVLAQRGNAVLLEPEDLRRQIAQRARTLAQELGISRLRVEV